MFCYGNKMKALDSMYVKFIYVLLGEQDESSR
jgi:hypothetical protein